MIFLRTYSSSDDAIYASERLALHGIPSHVTGKHSQKMSSAFTGSLESRLYILLEFQLEDANKFLKNNKHKITTGLSQKELIEWNQKLKTGVARSLDTVILYGVALSIILLGIFFYLYLK